MSEWKRHNYKWSVNEVLKLEREYDLLKWDIFKIANAHQRTPHAIICKLHRENLANYNELYDLYFGNVSNAEQSNDTKVEEYEEEEQEYQEEEEEEEEYEKEEEEEDNTKRDMKHIIQ
jgi:hypothetical protein